MLTCTVTACSSLVTASDAAGVAQRIRLVDTTDATIFFTAPNAHHAPASGKLLPMMDTTDFPELIPEFGAIADNVGSS